MQVEFTPACKKELTAQEERRVKDWRLDYDLRLACKEDVLKVIFFKSVPLPGGLCSRALALACCPFAPIPTISCCWI